MSRVTVRAIVGGIRSLVYRSLRTGESRLASRYTRELMQWGMGYQIEAETSRRGCPGRGGRTLAALGPEALERAECSAASSGGSSLSWEEPANSDRSRAELSQRERIMRATAQVTVENGYAALSIPAISATSGTSNQTFYEHFDSKQTAFLSCL